MLARLSELEKQIAATDDAPTAWRLNRAFHDAVGEMARSPRLAVVVKALAGIVPGNFFELVPGSVEVEKQGTAAILRALRRGDGEKAAQAYARMMRRQGDLVVQLFQRRGILPPGNRARPSA
jgi:DNA-binding GntR family transcriptional regulator